MARHIAHRLMISLPVLLGVLLIGFLLLQVVPTDPATVSAGPSATRAAAYQAVQANVHNAFVWIPLYHEPLFVVTGAKLKPIKAHGNYGCGLYKGLGIAFK